MLSTEVKKFKQKFQFMLEIWKKRKKLESVIEAGINLKSVRVKNLKRRARNKRKERSDNNI